MQRRNQESRELESPDYPQLASVKRHSNGRRKRRRQQPLWRRKVRFLGIEVRVWVLVLASAVVLLAADGTFAAWTLRSSLIEARDRFEVAGDALKDSRFGEARSELTDAQDAAQSASTATQHPGFLISYLVPGISRDARALSDMAEASRLTAEAGLAGTDAAEAMDPRGRGLATAIYEGGQIQFDALEQGKPGLVEAERLLQQASGRLSAAPQPSLDIVNDTLAQATTRVGDAAESAHRGRLVVESLPSLLAQGTERTYLLAFQAPGEARGTGGVIGLYGVLVARDGRLKLVDIAPYKALQRRPLPSGVVDAPRWFERRYSQLYGLRQWPQANLSAHFPEVSKVLLQMYEEATGERLDGVVAMDPVSFAQLTEATGPFDTKLGEVTSGNATEVLMHDSYLLDSPRAQDRYLSDLVVDFWGRVNGGNVDAVALGGGLSDSVNTQHFKMFAVNEQDQEALAAMDADGDFTRYGPNLQFVYHNQAAVGKVDYFLERSIDTTIEIDADGNAQVTTTVSMTNNAPDGPPSPLLGIGNFGDRPGTSAMYLNIVMPQGSRVEDFAINGKHRLPLRATEAGFPVAWDLVDVPPGDSAEVEITFTVPGAVDLNAEDAELEMTLIPQGTPNDDEFHVVIKPPYNYVAASDSNEFESDADGGIKGSGTISEVTVLEARLDPR